MLDIKYVRTFPEKVKNAVKFRKAKGANVDEILELDKARLELIKHVETHRALRNELSARIGKAQTEEAREKLIKEASFLKDELRKFEDDLQLLQGKLNQLMLFLPNIPCVDMPIGESEADNVEIAVWLPKVGYLPKAKLGKGNNSAKHMPNLGFEAKDHVALGKMYGIIDIEQSAKVSGSRFAYLKNDAVLLQDALAAFLKAKLLDEGFEPMIVPLLVREKVLYGTSHFPEGRDQVYKIESENVEDRNDLFLVGSSEPPLFAYYMDKVLQKKDLPVKMYALTSCFRSEVGSWGKDVYGIKRVHQFDKLEMDIVASPDNSREAMEYLREINEWFLQSLKLPYRIINKCSADAGYLASHLQYDVEVWLPSQQEFMEVMTDTNATDYQARRLGIKFRDESGLRFAHTVNDTGCAMGRMIIAVLDNNQKKDGTIEVPEVLRNYMRKEIIGK
ncbi:serine--tRNA ligase [candidate division WWE3 bacterium]|nr:serine--tRNA ligase [candidate division WWE3 bacterium]